MVKTLDLFVVVKIRVQYKRNTCNSLNGFHSPSLSLSLSLSFPLSLFSLSLSLSLFLSLSPFLSEHTVRKVWENRHYLKKSDNVHAWKPKIWAYYLHNCLNLWFIFFPLMSPIGYMSKFRQEKKIIIINKKHSENADISTSVTFDLMCVTLTFHQGQESWCH